MNEAKQKVKDMLKNAADNPTKENIQVVKRTLSLVKEKPILKAALNNDPEYQAALKRYNRVADKSKNKMWKKIKVAGATVVASLGLISVLQSCSLKKTDTPVEATAITETDYRNIPEADVEYDEVFDANLPEERINRIVDFLKDARSQGYGDEMFTIDQMLDVYTILNLDSLDPEEYAALGLDQKTVEQMMEHFGDFGIAVGQASMISTSDNHLSIADLMANKADAEYIRELENLLYSYNDTNADKATIANKISDLVWQKGVQEHTVSNQAQLIGFYLGYYGNVLTVNADTPILADKTQFAEIFGTEREDVDKSNTSGCALTYVNGIQSQFSESYTDTQKSLEAFLELVKDYRNTPVYKINVEEEIYKQTKDLVVGEHKDWNTYRTSYSKYQNNSYHASSYAGQITQEDRQNMVTLPSGQTVIVEGTVGETKEEQVEQKQIENNDALKTEASSAAVAQAKVDAYANNHNPSVPSQYASVSAEYIESYERAYQEWRKSAEQVEQQQKEVEQENQNNQTIIPAETSNTETKVEEKKEEVVTPSTPAETPTTPTETPSNPNDIQFDEQGRFETGEIEFIPVDELPEGAEVVEPEIDTQSYDEVQAEVPAVEETPVADEATATSYREEKIDELKTLETAINLLQDGTTASLDEAYKSLTMTLKL